MKKIASKRIILREHLEKDFLGNYQNWLLDSEVMEHTDTSINQNKSIHIGIILLVRGKKIMGCV
mgnify:CR=1 FL=1